MADDLQYQGFKDSFHKLQVDLDAALQKHQDDAAALVKALADRDATHAAAMAAALSDAEVKHAAAIVKLKESVLMPALKDLHSRQQADIAAKHQAELDSLMKG